MNIYEGIKRISIIFDYCFSNYRTASRPILPMNYKVIRYDFKNDDREEIDFDTLQECGDYVNTYVKECWIFPVLQFDIVLTVYCNGILYRYITLSNKYL